MKTVITILKGIIYIITIVLVAVFLLFLSFSTIPGDMATVGAGIDADEVFLSKLRKENNLDRPMLTRFISWIISILQGNLGISSRYNEPVQDLILRHARVTLGLTVFSFSLMLGFSFIIASIVVTVRRRTIAVWVAMINQVFLAIPQFWISVLVVYFFSVRLGWFTLFRTQLRLKDFFPPALVLAVTQSAYFSRYLMYSWKKELNKHYILSGLSRGLPVMKLRFLHALRGGLSSSMPVLGLIWLELLSGSIIVETIFMLPGLGQLLVTAVVSRDFFLVQGVTLYFIISVLGSNVIFKSIQYGLNPRLCVRSSD